MNKETLFLDFVNEKTCNKFSFLKLKQVFFDVKNNSCAVSFIYPADKDLNDCDREEIISSIRDYIKVDVKLDVKINKSYVESDLIFKQIKAYLEQNNKVFFNSFDFKNLTIEIKDGIVKINFELETSLQEYFDKFRIDKDLGKYLSKNFCAEFVILSSKFEDRKCDDKALENRIKEIREKSDLDTILSYNQDKYLLQDKRVLIGREITFNPRFIKTINKSYEDCVVAGKLNFLTERSFKRKSPKKDEKGENILIEKPYFSFQIKDDTGSINGVIFPSKTNYHKMNLLKNGDSIAVQGKIQKFNNGYEIIANYINLCSIPNKNEIEKITDQNSIVNYRYVRPQKYYAERQTNLFEDRHLSNEVKTHSFVVYDFETTGLDAVKDEIIEIGALKIVNGEYTEIFTTLVKPTRHIPEDATRINRITDDMVSHCFSIEQVLRDFYLFCKDCQMVGFNNLFFDSHFLESASQKINLKFDNEQIDAYLLAKKKIKGLKHYKLSYVAKYLDVNLIDAHRALNDVIATAEVFLKLY